MPSFAAVVALTEQLSVPLRHMLPTSKTLFAGSYHGTGFIRSHNHRHCCPRDSARNLFCNYTLVRGAFPGVRRQQVGYGRDIRKVRG
ncbi:hypothetical protein BDZ91DRAFT_816195 [Kalaharituber pfeilii]|nr:hypothetical protein BDZ91DRAFT_816195 [Kalaharituber pfeilii]